MKPTLTASLLVLTVITGLPDPGGADSIGTTYDMNRMLSEPHPMANEYGTRWQKPNSAPLPGRQPETLYRPATPVPVAPILPSTLPVPGQAPEPPPSTFPPVEPPMLTSTAPPAPVPQPAPKPPVVTEAETEPPLVMAPRLSLDTGGIDLSPEQETPDPVAAPPPPPGMDRPGPLPPLPPQ